MKAGILHRFSGMIAPLDYLKVLAKNNSHGFGFVHLGETGMEVKTFPGSVDMDVVFTAQTKFPRQTFYWAADLPSKYMESDLQPFVLLSQKMSRPDREALDIPLIALLMEGDFSRYYYKETGHVDAWNVSEKFFKPKVEQLWRLTNGNLDKVYEELSADHVKDEVGNVFTTNGNIVLVFANGKDIKYEKSDTCRQFEWGWVSNTYGWGKKTAVENMGDLLKGAAAPLVSAVKAVEGLGTPKAKPEDDPNKIEFYLKDYEKKRCPAGIDRGKRVDAWYRQNAGYLPTNARQERPFVYMLTDRRKAEYKLKAYRDKVEKKTMMPKTETAIEAAMNKALEEKSVTLSTKVPSEVPAQEEPKKLTASDRLKAKAAARKAAQDQAEVKPKDIEPHNLPKPDDKGVYHLTPKPSPDLINIEDLPILPPEDKVEILSYGKKFGDVDGEWMPNPDELKQIEAKLPDAFALLGFKGASPTYGWTFVRFKEIAQKHPDFGALLMMAYRNDGIRAKIALGALQTALQAFQSVTHTPVAKAG